MNMLTRIDKTVQIKGQNRALKETATLYGHEMKLKVTLDDKKKLIESSNNP